MYGVQFHPEVDLTKSGAQVFKNFLFKVSPQQTSGAVLLGYHKVSQSLL
jgi:hypothetical protein